MQGEDAGHLTSENQARRRPTVSPKRESGDQLAGSSPERENACGDGGAGDDREAVVKLPSLKQEPDTRAPSGVNGKVWRTGHATFAQRA
jgi:hypothetical protein